VSRLALYVALSLLATACAPRDRSDGSALYEASVRARRLVRAAALAHRVDVIEPRARFAVRCQGQALYVGHCARPDQAVEQRVDDRFAYDPESDTFAFTKSRVEASTTATARGVIGPHAGVAEDFADPGPRVRSAREIARYRAALIEMFPQRLLEAALADNLSLLSLPTPRGLSSVAVVAYTDPAQVTRTLALSNTNHRLQQLETLRVDPLWGDVVSVTSYRSLAGALQIATRELGRTIYDVRCAAVDPATVPFELAASEPALTEPPPARAEMSELSDGVYALRLLPKDYAMVIVDQADGLLVLEAPLDSDTAQLALSHIRARLGDRPIRYVAASHHHPDYLGGLRTFVAQGATLVTTPGNRDYLHRLMRAPHELVPDAQSTARREPAFLLVAPRVTIGRGPRRVEVYDVGPYTRHTAESLLYYFPEQKLVFEADMLRIPASAPRAAELLQAIRAYGLRPEQVFPSWPIDGSRKLISIEALAQKAESLSAR
jgi:glyoxylase-like metal-dependent hydrolase (beta-lactamase superfamily II)